MKNMLNVRWFIPLLLLLSACATSPKPGAARNPQSEPGGRVLWDAWYTITIGQGSHYGYYNDHVELKQDRVFYQYKMWKQEEGFLNEEQLGTFAEANPELTPLFYNFHSTYRAAETSIDGTVQDGRVLSVRIRKGNEDLPIVKQSLPKHAFFSQLFPVWLGYHLAALKPQQTVSFEAVLEDAVDREFRPVNGTVRLEKPDDFAKRTKTHRLTVDFQNKSTWWVDDHGALVKMVQPSQNLLVERVDEQKAKAFLTDSANHPSAE